MHLDLLGCAFTDAHVVDAPHVFLNIGRKVITGKLYRLVRHDTAKRDNGDLGCSAAYVDNHVAFRGENVEADAESCGHRLEYHICVAAAGVFT